MTKFVVVVSFLEKSLCNLIFLAEGTEAEIKAMILQRYRDQEDFAGVTIRPLNELSTL